ncbi:MAG: DUF1549 and DUF1553 domain-containing protein [Pirellulales bacterium]
MNGFRLASVSWSILLLTGLVSVPTPSWAGDVVPHGFRRGDWPFLPLERPAVPETQGSPAAANPIDAFILARLEQAGLALNRKASKQEILRRVTFDLTGLPPTVAELQAFLADESPEAYERVVNRLLASPRFGERWAQHWLDVVRYAETEGFKADRLRASAWRYRDYVIDSFNADRPFDEFVRQQLAGDELAPNDPQALVATGFLCLFPDEDNAANLFQRRQEILDDVTDTTSLTFLGLTMGCAQCHDHKFDEILQTDYFRLQAFFAGLTDRDDVPLATREEQAEHAKRQAEWEGATQAVREQMAVLLRPIRAKADATALEKYEADIQKCYLTPKEGRTPFQRAIGRMVERRLDWLFDEKRDDKLSDEDQRCFEALEAQLAEFASLKPAPLPMALAAVDLDAEPPATHLLEGGNWRKPVDEVAPGFPEFLDEAGSSPATAERLPTSSGRRLALARWLTEPDHPLTARVMVNRLWQHHFGRGIVATPNDFGLQGAKPTHPELLDWLAADLVVNGWRLKRLHRLIVTSATYRQSAMVDPAASQLAASVDPANDLLWHARRQRLDGEAIRDAMLAVAGELNQRMHGPSARPELPAGLSDRYAWKADAEAGDRNRRSVYVFAKRNMRYPLFEAFDQPDLFQSCSRRAVTVTAPQSLLLLNSGLTLELAEAWAKRLLEASPNDPRALAEQAYLQAFGRAPSDEEAKAAVAFLLGRTRASRGADQAAGEGASESSTLAPAAAADFCHALFNASEFITID